MSEFFTNYFEMIPFPLGILFPWFIIMSLIAFIAYGVDKKKAINGLYRTPEAVLIALAVLGGAFGAYMAMQRFRHKTKHLKFTVTVPLFSVIWTLLIAYCTFKTYM